jgi:hypothetical protein
MKAIRESKLVKKKADGTANKKRLLLHLPSFESLKISLKQFVLQLITNEPI